MNIKDLNIDYQVKTEELIKEAIFLQQYTRPIYQKTEENLIREKEDDYVR